MEHPFFFALNDHGLVDTKLIPSFYQGRARFLVCT
jgi:hypothetical protein